MDYEDIKKKYGLDDESGASSNNSNKSRRITDDDLKDIINIYESQSQDTGYSKKNNSGIFGDGTINHSNNNNNGSRRRFELPNFQNTGTWSWIDVVFIIITLILLIILLCNFNNIINGIFNFVLNIIVGGLGTLIVVGIIAGLIYLFVRRRR